MAPFWGFHQATHILLNQWCSPNNLTSLKSHIAKPNARQTTCFLLESPFQVFNSPQDFYCLFSYFWLFQIFSKYAKKYTSVTIINMRAQSLPHTWMAQCPQCGRRHKIGRKEQKNSHIHEERNRTTKPTDAGGALARARWVWRGCAALDPRIRRLVMA